MSTPHAILLAAAIILTTAAGANIHFELLPSNAVPRIINGSDAAFGQFPHQVSLRAAKNHAHFCGGSIITDRWILTAAHCTLNKQPDSFYAVLGTVKLSGGGARCKLRQW